MILLIYALRILLTRQVFRNDEFTPRDAAITAIMAPKGLAAAVLASLPLEYGVIGGETIRDITYMVVLISITLTALLVIVYPASPVQRVFASLLGKSSKPATVPEIPVDSSNGDN